MLTGTVSYSTRKPFTEVVAEAPAGKVAAFKVVMSREDSDLGEIVGYSSGGFYNVITEEPFRIEAAEQLAFLGYMPCTLIDHAGVNPKS